MDTKPIVDKNNVTWTVRLEESIGNYGVLVLHDKDLNGKMKTNAVGKPKEGVGASRGNPWYVSITAEVGGASGATAAAPAAAPPPAAERLT